MAKNILKSLMFSFLLMRVFALGIYADVAPDPVTRAIGLLPIVLIAAVVIFAVILLVNFFRKK